MGYQSSSCCYNFKKLLISLLKKILISQNESYFKTITLRVIDYMKKQINIVPSLTVVGLTLILSGCASDPVPVVAQAPVLSGEQMISESQRLASLGERWKKGKDLVDRGTVLVRDGKNKIDESNRMILEGQKIQNESELSVKTVAPVLSGEQMISESQRLANLGDRWKKGKDLIDRGAILAREGQNNIEEGNRLAQEGEQIQHESEESSNALKK